MNNHLYLCTMRILILCIALTLFAVDTRAQELNVMTYNIRYDNPGDGVNAWPNRKEKVVALLKKYNPDLLGVQEALLHQITDMTNGIPVYAYLGVGRDDGKDKGEFSAILYKKDLFDVVTQGTFWLSETPDVPGSKSWDASITRVVTWAKFRDKKSGREFIYLNTHFDHIGKEARKNSAALLRKKAAEISHSLPVIITGDFNCTRDEAPYNTMIAPGPLPLQDALSGEPIGTFCTFQVNGPACRAIDYLFYSDAWLTDQYRVITDHDGANYPSDHLPVMAHFEIKK